MAAGWPSWDVLDFAGGTVVHINAGMSALALALLLRPRKGFKEGVPMEPNNIPMVMLGAGLLWFGWFGFNGGSALTSGGLASSAFVATNIAAAAAAFTWMIFGLGLPPPLCARGCNRGCSRAGGNHARCWLC